MRNCEDHLSLQKNVTLGLFQVKGTPSGSYGIFSKNDCIVFIVFFYCCIVYIFFVHVYCFVSGTVENQSSYWCSLPSKFIKLLNDPFFCNLGAISSRISVHMTNPINAQDARQDVNITYTLVPRLSTMASQAGLLNSAYFFVWGRICETRLDNWCLISHWIQSTARF